MTTVETATLDDVEALVEAWVALAAGQREHGSHVLAGQNRDRIRDTLGSYLLSGGLLVAREEGAVVGFVMFHVDSGGLATDVERGVVENVYVDPAHRGTGLGSRLLDHAEDHLRRLGADVVSLEVMADNEDARRLYRRRGYEVHRLMMEKALEDGQKEPEEGADGDDEPGEDDLE